MKRLFLIFSFSWLIFFSCTQYPPADLILHNGKIFTSQSEIKFVEAFAIRDGKILATGSSRNILDRYRTDSTEVIDLNQRLVLPGLHDAHLHFWSGARLARELDFRGVPSLDSIFKMVKKAVEKTPPGEWIVGRGWDHELWPSRELPNRRMLDKISRQHYIFLKRVDGHAAWVNTAVLRLLRLNQDTPDPPGGKIMRHPQTGELTGILFDAAFDLIEQLIPEPTTLEKKDLLQKTIQKANRLGITSITDNSPSDIYAIYADLYKENLLTVRVNFMAYFAENLDSLNHYFEQVGIYRPLLQPRLVKLFIDGSLGSRTALLKQPYRDMPNSYGLLQHPFSELLKLVEQVDSTNYQVAVHAIGDSGISLVLDAYETIYQKAGAKDRRWRIEHAQVMDSADFKRFARLGVIASMQPSHCITDLHWAEERIGERIRYAYAWRSFLEHNVVLAFGTDWPVEPLNPFVGIYAAVTRQDTTGFPHGGWVPEEGLTIGEAIRAYTVGSSYAARMENVVGTLTPGKAADFIVLDRDIFQSRPDEILRTHVLATFVDGRQVYSHPQF